MSSSELTVYWITEISTSVAALAAVVAIVVSTLTIRQDRTRQVLRDRHALAVDLLAAFEELHGQGVAKWQYELPEDPSEEARLTARVVALLHASGEDLPITRTTFFNHIPYGADSEAQREHLTRAPRAGNPEADDELVMAMRAELIDSIEGLRRQLFRV